MSHSAGFSYGNGKTVVDAMYQQQNVMQSANLEEMVDKLGTIPLNYEPGKKWMYSASMDVEGYIVERLSGQTLPDFMREHIFEPLGMKDAGFFVPAEKRARFATNYRDDGWAAGSGAGCGGRADGLCGAAADAFGGRRIGVDGGGLLPVCADAGEWRGAGWEAGAVAGDGEADDVESSAGEFADGGVGDWAARDAAGIWVWVQLRGGVRSCGRRDCRMGRGRFSGMGRRGRGSGWIRRTMWCLWG